MQSHFSPQESTWEALGCFRLRLKGGRAGWCEESRGAVPHWQFSEGSRCSCFHFSVLPSLLDRLGDSKDSVREQDQTLLLKIMEQAANPQVCLTTFCSMSGCLKRTSLFLSEGFLLYLCLKWFHLPPPCYVIFVSLGNAVACQDTHGSVSGFHKYRLGCWSSCSGSLEGTCSL